MKNFTGLMANVLEARRQSGELLSSDRFHVGCRKLCRTPTTWIATEVRFMLKPNELLVCNNGNPVRLEHVLGLATP